MEQAYKTEITRIDKNFRQFSMQFEDRFEGILDGKQQVNFVNSVINKPFVDARDYGAKGDGITDDTAAIQRAIDSIPNGGVVYFPPGIYKTSSALELKSNVTLRGSGYSSKITSAGSHDIFHAEDIDRAGLKFLHLSGGNSGITIFGGSTRCFVENCFLDSLGKNGVFINGALYCRVVHNYIDSVGKNGVYIYNGSHDNIVSLNHIISPEQMGVSMYNGSTRNLVKGNNIYNTAENGIFVNDLTGSTHSNHNSIIDNMIYRTGVSHVNGGNGIELGLEQIGGIVQGNTVIEAGYGRSGDGVTSAFGISVHGSENSICGNRVIDSLYHGISLYEARDSICNDNIVKNSSQESAAAHDGIRVTGTVTNPSVQNTIHGNRCFDDQGTKTQDYGIRESGSYANFNSFMGNMVRGNIQDIGILLAGAGSRAIQNMHSASIALASATTLTLPNTGDYFRITGTIDITSITASWSERRVVIRFGDVLKLTDGSNLRLAGDFDTTGNDVITLFCDGTNWNEESRSIN